MSLKQLISDLKKKSDPVQKENLQRFFKTGKGQYGEGDIFIGLKVPDIRKIIKKYLALSLPDLQILLNSKIHEHRMASLFILVAKYNKANEKDKKRIFDFYLKNTKNINNWDLVDLSAPKIIGNYLIDKKQERIILYKLAKSNDLWEKRIAIISTFAFIYSGEAEDTFKISEILLSDSHDLIHKAVGWMLREVGKRVSREKEVQFLKRHYRIMPRTMLRYAIEHFSEDDRRYYLQKS